jgi:uncharacterized membrane protein YphA (DoxX/SURF4 family)
MAAEKPTAALGWRVFGLGVVAMGLVCLAWGDFDPGQPVPKAIPDRTTLAYAAATFMVAAGAAIAWGRTAAWGAAALAGYYAVIVVVLMNGRVILGHPAEYVAYSGAAEQSAIAACGLIVFAANARIEPQLAARLTRMGQVVFAVCALLFGGAHFVYLKETIAFAPKWLPPGPAFWAYATGIGHIAAGLAILSGVRARLAAILLTVMYASFTFLVHTPMLLADRSSRINWSESALNLALIGAAWVVADSLARAPRVS